MKYHYKIVFLLIFFGIFSVSESKADDEIFSVATSEFKTQGGDESLKWLGPSCADAIINRISTDKKVRIVEREYINKIIEELKLQMTGLVDEKTALEIGRIIGADYFIFGTVSIYNQNVALNARVANVETSEIVSTSRITGKLDDIFKLQEDLAKKISEDLAFNSVIFSFDNVDVSEISFSVYSKLDQLKKLAEGLPIFILDPARRRKTADYTLGIKISDELLSQNPELYLAHYYKALFSIHLQDNNTANVSTKVAKKLNPDDINVLLLRAGYFLINNDFDKAETLLKFITGKYPADSKAWYGLAKTYMKTGKDYLATECLINSLAGNKFLTQAQANLRTLIAGTKQLNKSSFSDEKYYNSAMVFRAFWNKNQGITKEIYEMANMSAASFPDLFMPFYIQGYYFIRKNDIKSAEESYLKCLKLCPAFPYVHRELALLYFNAKQCKKAEKHAMLYLGTAMVINDYDDIEKARKNCK